MLDINMRSKSFDLFNELLRSGEDVYILGTNIKGSCIDYNLAWDQNNIQDDMTFITLRIKLNNIKEEQDLVNCPVRYKIKYPYTPQYAWDREYLIESSPRYPVFAEATLSLNQISKIPFGTEAANILYNKEEE